MRALCVISQDKQYVESRSEKIFHAIKLLGLLFVTLQISACANKNIAFRALPPTAQECHIYADNKYSTKFQSSLTNDHNLPESEIIGPAAGCYEQRDELVLENTSSTIKYQLNFLEFKENGELREPNQWDAVRNALSQKSGPKYVVLFVHGWRHDARLDDANVRSFRSMLAYSARSLHDRQDAYGKDAQVFGIYVGWPGNEWKWKWIDGMQIPAFLTFWSRKKESEDLAPYVADYIHRIKDHINSGNGSPGLDRFLIVGHSFGGNLLINALKRDYQNAIPDIPKMNSPVKGISDLTVLLNPASDFSNWQEIQKVEYERSGYHQPPEYKSFVHGENDFFDVRQKPILMSITATCDWGKVNKKDGHFDCDWATGWAYPIGQILALRTGLDQRKALGHVRAYVSPKNSYFQNQDYGITHELEDNTSTIEVENRREARVTSYVNAAKEISSCPLAGNWLNKVQRPNNTNTGREWDTADEPIPSISDYRMQMRHGAFRHKLKNQEGKPPRNKSYSTLGPAHEPFWNVASHESIVPDHTTVFSKQLWCLLDQIVLDPMTESP